MLCKRCEPVLPCRCIFWRRDHSGRCPFFKKKKKEKNRQGEGEKRQLAILVECENAHTSSETISGDRAHASEI